MTTKRWTAEQIKKAVYATGKTFRGLARERELHPLAPSTALIRRHIDGEKAIADCIGVPLWEIWPDRWMPDGQRVDHRLLPPKGTCVPIVDARQKAAAA